MGEKKGERRREDFNQWRERFCIRGAWENLRQEPGLITETARGARRSRGRGSKGPSRRHHQEEKAIVKSGEKPVPGKKKDVVFSISRDHKATTQKGEDFSRKEKKMGSEGGVLFG